MSHYFVYYVETTRHPLFRLPKYRPFLEYHTNDSAKSCFVFVYISYDYAPVNVPFSFAVAREIAISQLMTRESWLFFHTKDTCLIFQSSTQHMIRLTVCCQIHPISLISTLARTVIPSISSYPPQNHCSSSCLYLFHKWCTCYTPINATCLLNVI